MSRLPTGWTDTSLGDLAELITKGESIQWQGNVYVQTGVPFLRTVNVLDGRLVLNGCKFVEKAVHARMKRSQLQPGDLLISIAGTLGRCCLVPRGLTEANINQDVALIRLGRKEADPCFLLAALRGPAVRAQIDLISQGGTRNHLNLKQTGGLRVWLPPLVEQRKIAAILSSVDDAIEKTQAVIDQVQVVKKGLMQELLTRGLPGRHTRFKQTEIGEVPEEWEVVRLGHLFKLTSGKGIAVRLLAESPAGHARYPVYGGNGVAGYTDEAFVDPPVLIIGRVGEYCGVVHCAGERCWVSDNALFTREFLQQVNVPFLYRLLQHEDLSKLRKKTGQPLVTQGPIHDVSVALPTEPEQSEIAAILDEIDSRLRIEGEFLGELRRTKSALMSVLLTGEVRVTSDSEAA